MAWGNGVAVGLIHRGCSGGACTLKLVPELGTLAAATLF